MLFAALPPIAGGLLVAIPAVLAMWFQIDQQRDTDRVAIRADAMQSYVRSCNALMMSLVFDRERVRSAIAKGATSLPPAPDPENRLRLFVEFRTNSDMVEFLFGVPMQRISFGTPVDKAVEEAVTDLWKTSTNWPRWLDILTDLTTNLDKMCVAQGQRLGQLLGH
jgi:hypothetical protein